MVKFSHILTDKIHTSNKEHGRCILKGKNMLASTTTLNYSLTKNIRWAQKGKCYQISKKKQEEIAQKKEDAISFTCKQRYIQHAPWK